MANQPEVLQSYRYHEGSVSGRRRDEQMHYRRRAVREAADRRGVKAHYTAHEHWRPDQTRRSRHEYAVRLGWWAFNEENYDTATAFGRNAIGLRPLSPDGWKLLLKSIYRGQQGGDPEPMGTPSPLTQ